MTKRNIIEKDYLPQFRERIFSKRVVRDMKNLKIDSFHFPVEVLMEKLLQGENVYCYGPVGTGKTTFACLLAQELYTQQLCDGKTLSVSFFNIPKFLEDIKDSFNGNDSTVKQRALESDILVFDDLGVEKVSEWVLQTLYLIINERFAGLQPTIITSNKSMSELLPILGDRIISRMAEYSFVDFKNEKNHRNK